MFFLKMRQEFNDFFYEQKFCRILLKPLLFPFFCLYKLIRLRRNTLDLDHLEIVVGTKCTLHCRKCANLMQYYRSPIEFQPEQLKEDIRMLLELDISFDRVNLIGGEPFLYARLPELISLLQNSPKVKTIRIVTNGTIVPPQSFIEALKSSKVILFVSNYISIGAKTNETYQILKKAGVNAQVVSAPWLNYHHNFSGYNRSKEDMNHVYHNCKMACHELFDGEIHLCPTSANGMKLGFIPRDENCFVSIRHDGSKQMKKEIIRKMKKLLFEQIPNACNYCDTGSEEIIPTAEQLPAGTYLDSNGEVRKRDAAEIR